MQTTTEIPIACDTQVFVSQEDAARQLALNFDVLLRWPKSRQELPDGYLYQYEGNEELFVTLARYAANEHRCCPFATYSVEMGPFSGGKPGSIQLRITAGAEGKAFLTDALAYAEELFGKLDLTTVDYGQLAEQVARDWEKHQQKWRSNR